SQFRYDYKSSISDADNVVKDQDKNKEKWFWVQFDSKSVDDLLAEAQIPVWGNSRPVTLVWFSQEINAQRLLRNQYEEPESYKLLQESAGKRGISLMFPFLDLQDQNSISANDIWSDFNDTISQASRRYQAQAILTIRLYQAKSALWNSHWNLLLLGKSQTWTMQNKNREQLLLNGIDELADRLAQQFIPVVSKNDGTTDSKNDALLIQVDNVSGYSAFQTLDKYFKSLASARTVALIKVNQNNVIYKIQFLGDKTTLMQEIKSGDLLNPIEKNRIRDELNQNKDYKPVILDGLDKKPLTEKDTMLKAGLDKTPESSSEPLSAPKIEELIPDLKYWFVR
ncbi:MAG: DUF2066 domain-containing protein, partial [Thiotrichaceae bacterium]|nr:DUF2066 domain-containing protein [Thiotrichaceae bacterium]